MAEKKPTAEQISNTEKLLGIIDNVPEEKKQEAIRLAQALLLGATAGSKEGG